jgi:hypothetical protein
VEPEATGGSLASRWSFTSWNANFAANQPVYLGVQNGWPILHRSRNLKLQRKQHFIFVAKIHQRPKRQPFRRGKLHWPGSYAVGKRPVNMRRLAGVAGILPIDMPARLQLEVQPGNIAPGWIDLVFGNHQLHMQVRGIGGTGRRQRRQARCKQEQKYENQTGRSHGRGTMTPDRWIQCIER